MRRGARFLREPCAPCPSVLGAFSAFGPANLFGAVGVPRAVAALVRSCRRSRFGGYNRSTTRSPMAAQPTSVAPSCMMSPVR